MQITSDIDWRELKNQYQSNLQTLQSSIGVARKTANELSKLQNIIMKKSKDTSSETMKKFTEEWLTRLDVKNDESFQPIIEEYKMLLVNSSEKDFENFEQALCKLSDQSLNRMNSYQTVRQTFYNAWKEIWPN